MSTPKALRLLASSCLTTALVTAGALIGPTVAEAAATTQRICNSKNSAGTIYVYDTYGNEFDLARSKCVPAAAKPTYVYVADASYRVGYNLGPYSDCRYGGRGFTPYQKADTIYFRTYNGFFCET